MDSVIQARTHCTATEADFRIAAAVALLWKYGDEDPVFLSREVSKILERQILIVNQADLSYSPGDAGRTVHFNDVQIAARAAELHAASEKAFPDQKDFWGSWKWKDTAGMSTASCDYNTCASPVPAISTRLSGPIWSSAAVITLPHRQIEPDVLWNDVMGFRGDKPVALPKDRQVTLHKSLLVSLFGHEAGHTMQLRSETIDNEEAWSTEKDSDQGSFFATDALGAEEPSLPDIKTAMLHSRALGGFRNTYARYWSALALDTKDVSFLRSVQCGYELRLRVMGHITGARLPKSSEELQDIVTNWWFLKPSIRKFDHVMYRLFDDHKPNRFNWKKYNHLDVAIPALREVMRSGAISDPLTFRNGELVMAAAEYFRPSLKEPAVAQRFPHQAPSYDVPAVAA